MMPRRHSLLITLPWLALLALGLVGCASPHPYVSVVAASRATVEDSRALVVVVEIHNPTRSLVRLSSLEYSLGQAGKRERSVGRIALDTSIAPGASQTVDIQVPVRGETSEAQVDLRGHLHGYAGEVQVDWAVDAKGQIQ
jgi:hypothetical protein